MNPNRYLLPIFIVLGLIGAASARAQSLVVSFAQDTLYACEGEALVLRPDVSGGQAPYQYSWNNGTHHDSLLILPVGAAAAYRVAVLDNNGQGDSASVWVVPLPECVYPGDGNGDRVADVKDVLALGYAFNSLGPIRPDAHLQWIGQAAPAWGQTLNTGVDFVHADADGDGLVAVPDFSVVAQNYSGPQDTGWSTISSQGVSLTIQLPNSIYGSGDTIRAEIWAEANAPTDSIYGIAFSVGFDQFLVQANSVVVDYEVSDLGQIGADLYGADQVFYTDEQVDIGLSRLDQLNRTANAHIADIIITIEDLEGKRAGIEMLSFDLKHITLVDKHGNLQRVSPTSAEVPIEFGVQTSSVNAVLAEDVRVFPQPARHRVNVSWPETWQRVQLELVDAQGKKCLSRVSDQAQHTLDLQGFSAGVYVLHLKHSTGQFTRKLLIGQ